MGIGELPGDLGALIVHHHYTYNCAFPKMVCAVAKGKYGAFKTISACQKVCHAAASSNLPNAASSLPDTAPKGSKLEKDLIAVEEDVESPIDEGTLEAAEAKADQMAKEKAETEASSEETNLERAGHKDTEMLQEEEENEDAKAKKKVVEEDAAELKEETKEAGGSPVSPPTLSTAINSFLDELSKSPTAEPTATVPAESVDAFLDELSTAPTAIPTGTITQTVGAPVGAETVTGFLDGLSTAPTAAPTGAVPADSAVSLDSFLGELSTAPTATPSTELSAAPSATPSADPTYLSNAICKKSSCNVCEEAREECCNDFMHSSGQCEGCVKSKGCTLTMIAPEVIQTAAPTAIVQATAAPTVHATAAPTVQATSVPTATVVAMPPVTETPTAALTIAPTAMPSLPAATGSPSVAPTAPTATPTAAPITYVCTFPQMQCAEAEGADGTFTTLVSCKEACHMPTETPSALPTASPSFPPTVLPTSKPTTKIVFSHLKISVLNASKATGSHPCKLDSSYFNAGPPATCIPCYDLTNCPVGKYRLGCGGGVHQVEIGACVACQTPSRNAHHTSFGKVHGNASSCDEDCNRGYHESSGRCVAVTSTPTAAPTAAPTAVPTDSPRVDSNLSAFLMPKDQFIVRSCIQMTGFTIKDFDEIAKLSFRVALASVCQVRHVISLSYNFIHHHRPF
jgi:hypothetical protein